MNKDQFTGQTKEAKGERKEVVCIVSGRKSREYRLKSESNRNIAQYKLGDLLQKAKDEKNNQLGAYNMN